MGIGCREGRDEGNEKKRKKEREFMDIDNGGVMAVVERDWWRWKRA